MSDVLARPSLLRSLCAAYLVVGGALVACSSDGSALEGRSALDSDESGEDLHGDHESDFDAGSPNDDPNLGGDGVEPMDEGEATDDAGASTVAGNGCVPGGHYCGGDKVSGDPATLYRCTSADEAVVDKKCAFGCAVNPGQDDSCKADPTARVASPVPGKRVTYAYGVRNSRYAAGYHTGEDYATPTGSTAVAVRSGTIRWSNDNGGAYGKWIGLDADNGRTYVYCHLSSRSVAAGTKVTAGQTLAKTGATGNVTGPHLHFEDHPVGPFRYGQVRKPAW